MLAGNPGTSGNPAVPLLPFGPVVSSLFSVRKLAGKIPEKFSGIPVDISKLCIGGTADSFGTPLSPLRAASRLPG